MKFNNFLTVEDLNEEILMYLLNRASELKSGEKTHLARKYIVANLFFENSTRTNISFQIAEHKLGLHTINVHPNISSVQKGETLYDTVLTLASLETDLVVIRHFTNEYYTELVGPNITCSIINAGDGSGQHPTQCLLDLMTIYEEFGRFTDLKIAIVGDLTHSRVAKSNMILLHKLGATLYFSGPSKWYDPSFNAYGKYLPLDDLMGEVDIMLMLRVQHERHNSEESFSQQEYHAKFGLTIKRYIAMKPNAIIMHPGPVNRNVELDSSLVESAKSRFTQQMHNGLYTRMALIETILNSRREE